MKELLSNKVFKIIMATDIIQQLCIWVRNIAVLFYIVEVTNSDPIYLSLITILEYLPMFVFSYIGGTLADRWNPKKTMIIGDFLSSISIFAILILISQGAWHAVFAVTFISSIVTQFSVPSSLTMFKKHIREDLLTPAISISQALQSLYIIIGPIIGTLLYVKIGINFSLALIAVMLLISSAIQFLLPNTQKETSEIKTALFYELREGILYMKTRTELIVLAIILAILGIAEGLIQPLSIFIITNRLNLQKENLQWFYTLTGIGLLCGAIFSANIMNKFKTKNILFGVFVSFSLITIIEVLSTNILLTGTMYLFSGISIAFIQVAISTPLVKKVDEAIVGRINGLITPLFTGGILIGSSLSGALFKQLSLIPVFLLSAVIILIGGIISLKYKD